MTGLKSNCIYLIFKTYPMKSILIILIIFLYSFVYFTHPALNPPTPNKKPIRHIFPSYDPKFPPPVDAPQVFELSQDYPDTFNVEEKYPWQTIDFKTKPDEYIHTVLNYCLEGNEEVDFKVQDNKKRHWYHSPWLHSDGRKNGNGREYIFGLTRERATPPYELHKSQNIALENWAIGFYNAPGGYVLNKVWNTGGDPNPALCNFPEGTVSFKLLFTDGTTDKVPFLKGTKIWTANIYASAPTDTSHRINREVRLLQIDIAVKDKRAGTTGWVFGTFVYDGSKTGSIWERMVSVGLSWGDDPDVQSSLNREGAFLNPDLKDTYLNSELIENPDTLYTNQSYMKHHGLGGRLNGPVDNPVSSCISCHGRAAVTDKGKAAPLGDFGATRANYSISSFKKYFSEIKGGSHIEKFGGKEYTTTDYSLQIANGIRNYYENKYDNMSILSFRRKNLPIITRGEK